jgi:hypothetical protein
VAELHFSTDQIQAEMNGMADLAAEFLERAHSQLFREAAYSLASALRTNGIWQIPQDHPLDTTVAERQGGALFGRLSFRWEVRKLTPRTFSVSGNASTTMGIYDLGGSSGPLLSWNTDIGGAGHPGYRFHVQFKSDDKSVEIPRLPSILLTPADCLDFLLGELFQEKWTRHQLDKQTQTAGWIQGVRIRICHLLLKKAECAQQSRGITPWMTLKVWDLKSPKLTLCDD